jgi:hypothetical protein
MDNNANIRVGFPNESRETPRCCRGVFFLLVPSLGNFI